MDDPQMPSRLRDAQSVLQALWAGRLPPQQTARSAASALDELQGALVLKDDLLDAARTVRLIAKGAPVEIDIQTRRQARRLWEYIASLAH